MKGLLFFLLAIAFSANADDAMLTKLKTTLADPALHKAAIQAGQKRIILCKYCHGADGISLKDTIPNLASQNPVYLLNQFELFAKGQRINKTMNELAKILSTDDRINVALYYASQKVRPNESSTPQLVETGQKLFMTRCFFCHGKEGHGQEKFPRIAGQPEEFLNRTLTSYNSVLVKRAETEMTRIARQLKPEEIKALASYITTME